MLTALWNHSPDSIEVRGENIAGITFSLAEADFTSFVSVVAKKMELVPLVLQLTWEVQPPCALGAASR